MKFLSYNIKGLFSKLCLADFFDYLRSFDVFILCETHVEEANEYNKYFGGFDISWKFATRRSSFGRASGGCVYGVKKGLRNVGVNHSFIKIDGLDIIKLTVDKTHLHLIPLYLRPTEWLEDFEKLSNVLLNRKIDNIIIVGDLNVRIGSLQIQLAENYLGNLNNVCDERKSKDLVINAKGKQLLDLCENMGLFILNGSTVDDKSGNFTFISSVGNSVNDICAVDQELLFLVDNFIVDSK